VRKILTGNHTVSYAVKLSRVEVIAAYPITPQTSVVEKLSEWYAKGELDARFIKVESEHSAMASCIGASAAGVRAFTATSAQGLALMHELLHWATGARLPIVLVNVNRAMAAPWTIWCDQNDSLSQRDTGWLQFYCESNQEVLDSVIQAYRISEQIQLPTMIAMDAFFLSHTMEPVDLPDEERVDRYLPQREAEYRLDIDDPHTFYGGTTPPFYAEMRYKIQQAMEEAKGVVETAAQEFRETFGRGYEAVELYRAEDAEMLLVTAGTMAGTARCVVDELRDDGRRVGAMRIRMFRPFPTEEVRRAVAGAKRVGVVDRNISFGQSGIFFQEMKSALFDEKERPLLFGFIAGLGGRDVTMDTVRRAVDYMSTHDEPEEATLWLDIKR